MNTEHEAANVTEARAGGAPLKNVEVVTRWLRYRTDRGANRCGRPNTVQRLSGERTLINIRTPFAAINYGSGERCGALLAAYAYAHRFPNQPGTLGGLAAHCKFCRVSGALEGGSEGKSSACPKYSDVALRVVLNSKDS